MLYSAHFAGRFGEPIFPVGLMFVVPGSELGLDLRRHAGGATRCTAAAIVAQPLLDAAPMLRASALNIGSRCCLSFVAGTALIVTTRLLPISTAVCA